MADQAHNGLILPPHNAAVFTPTDNVTDLPDGILPTCWEASQDGVVVIDMAGEGANIVKPVTAGTLYPTRVKRFRLNNGAGTDHSGGDITYYWR